ncbi:MAG: TolC family protein [Chitinophagales bacterium]|nr:TolC family protein [Chitinophagales bacterium]
MKKTALLFATALLYSFAFSQTTYTLKQCIDYALKNHKSIKMSENDVETAYARKREGQSVYLPQINAQAKWDDNLILQSSVIPSLTFGTITTPEQVVKFGNQYNSLVGIELDQMLFNWSFIQGIKAIKPGYDIAKTKKIKTEEDVTYNTIIAYYNILLINENEKLLKQNEERLSKTIPIVKLQYDKGVIRKIDVDKVQVNYNNIIAHQQILASNKQVALNNLKYNMGMSLDSVITIDTVYSKEMVDANNYVDTTNIKNKIEMQLMRKNIFLQEILLKRTKAAYYPQFGFYAKYGGLAFGNEFSQSFTRWSQFASIGFKLDIPIFDGLRTSSNVRMAKLNIANLKEDMALKEEGLKLQMLNAKTTLQNSQQNLLLSKENIDLAKNIYDVTTLQYQKGVISYTDWISAEFSYKEAEQNYMTSLVGYLQSKIEADKSNNNINSYKQ